MLFFAAADARAITPITLSRRHATSLLPAYFRRYAAFICLR